MSRSLIAFFALLMAAHPVFAGTQNLAALCERFDNEAFIAIWESEGLYTIDGTDAHDWSGTKIEVQRQSITLTSPRLYEAIVIPAGKNDVNMAGADFHCDY